MTQQTMTVKELRALLVNIPDDTEIGYRDENFGGMLRQLTTSDFTWYPHAKWILLTSPFWEPVS